VDEIVLSKAMYHYICQLDVNDYKMGWYSGHAAVCFIVQKSAPAAPKSKIQDPDRCEEKAVEVRVLKDKGGL
jgi:hypothetical protein